MKGHYRNNNKINNNHIQIHKQQPRSNKVTSSMRFVGLAFWTILVALTSFQLGASFQRCDCYAKANEDRMLFYSTTASTTATTTQLVPPVTTTTTTTRTTETTKELNTESSNNLMQQSARIMVESKATAPTSIQTNSTPTAKPTAKPPTRHVRRSNVEYNQPEESSESLPDPLPVPDAESLQIFTMVTEDAELVKVEALYDWTNSKKIPPIFHFAWISLRLEGRSNVPDKVLKLMAEWQKLHPTWTTVLWTNEMVRLHFPDLVQEILMDVYNESWGSNLIRYSVLNKFGGVYMDTDVEVVKNIEPLRNILHYQAFTVCANPRVDVPISATINMEINRNASGLVMKDCKTAGPAVIASAPGHPAIAKTLETSVRNSKRALQLGRDYDRDVSGTYVWSPNARYSDTVAILYSSTFFPCKGHCSKESHPREMYLQPGNAHVFAVHRSDNTWGGKITRESFLQSTAVTNMRPKMPSTLFQCSSFFTPAISTAITSPIVQNCTRMTIGVVANEFFDPRLGRTGGFGLATNMVGELFGQHPELGICVVFIFASPQENGNLEDSKLGKQVVHDLLGWPLISMMHGEESETTLKNAGIDVLLLIDYRKTYNDIVEILPTIPVILWARDPRTPDQLENVRGIQLPKAMNNKKRPKGCGAPNATAAVNLMRSKEGSNRPLNDVPRNMVLAVPWLPGLYDRLEGAYSIPPTGNAWELNNILGECGTGPESGASDYFEKSETPAVTFIGRLDPYKRPWLLVELAKRFPNVEFWVFGRRHFEGPGSYDIQTDSGPLPENIKLYGQVTGEEKWDKLRKAWFTISTSAHEGVAINYLEALLCQTPLISTVNPGGLVSSYGKFVGEFSGSGEQGLDALEAGFRQLLEDEELRLRLGKEGRKHVLETHSAKRFLEGFEIVASRMNLPGSQAEPDIYVHPVSMVIPSFSRMELLPDVLAHHLTLENMEHPDSEIIVAHASEESWNQRAAIHTLTNEIIVSTGNFSSFEVSKIIHVNVVPENDKWGCVSRHFAALQVRHDVVIHLDDDLKLTDEGLRRMVKYVREEPGFPFYSNAIEQFPNFYGSFLRYCGKNGYQNRGMVRLHKLNSVLHGA